MIHSAGDAESSVDTLQSILNGTSGIPIASDSNGQGNRITHVLSFNEPDGSTSGGGTNTSPKSAAKAYIEYLRPLRQSPYNLKLGLPATTGSPSGIEWLQQFNASCYQLSKSTGCEFDFIAAHWYGDFPGLQNHISSLHNLWPEAKIWVTEIAIPAVSVDETLAMMNASLPWLDATGYVERYAWFGSFRTDEANGWTKDAVSVFDGDGKLTQLGAEWLGRGFREGESGASSSGGSNAAKRVGWDLRAVLSVVTLVVASIVI
jgi:hypothetical protein